jgi:hypothetical protein
MPFSPHAREVDSPFSIGVSNKVGFVDIIKATAPWGHRK